jgi:hypothetical protein
MKINNKNTIKSLLTILLAMSVASVFMLAVSAFCFPFIFRKIQFLGYLFVICCVIKIFRLKYIEYENSGEVLSLKRCSIFHLKKQKNQIEIPLYKVNNLYLRKSFWYNYLIINFHRDDHKYMKIHFPIDHIKTSDLQKIQKNFKHHSIKNA